MNTNVSRFALMLGSASLVLASTSLLADEDHFGGLYMTTDAGVNLADKLVVPEGSISLDPGVRWDLTMGYGIKLSDQVSLAPEAEIGLIYNSFGTASSGGVSSLLK